MKQLLIIFSILITLFGCSNKDSSNLISYDVTLDSLCIYKLLIPKNYKLISGNGNSLTITDSLTKKKVEIEPCSDWVVPVNGLHFEHKYFKDFVEYRVDMRYSFDDIGLIKVTHTLDNYKEFNNSKGVKIYKTGLIYETQAVDSSISKIKCAPIYLIEIPNVKIRAKDLNYVRDRALQCEGDSIMMNVVIDNLEFKE